MHFYHSQVMLLLLVPGPHSEDNCPGQLGSMECLKAKEKNYDCVQRRQPSVE